MDHHRGRRGGGGGGGNNNNQQNRNRGGGGGGNGNNRNNNNHGNRNNNNNNNNHGNRNNNNNNNNNNPRPAAHYVPSVTPQEKFFDRIEKTLAACKIRPSCLNLTLDPSLVKHTIPNTPYQLYLLGVPQQQQIQFMNILLGENEEVTDPLVMEQAAAFREIANIIKPYKPIKTSNEVIRFNYEFTLNSFSHIIPIILVVTPDPGLSSGSVGGVNPIKPSLFALQLITIINIIPNDLLPGLATLSTFLMQNGHQFETILWLYYVFASYLTMCNDTGLANKNDHLSNQSSNFRNLPLGVDGKKANVTAAASHFPMVDYNLFLLNPYTQSALSTLFQSKNKSLRDIYNDCQFAPFTAYEKHKYKNKYGKDNSTGNDDQSNNDNVSLNNLYYDIFSLFIGFCLFCHYYIAPSNMKFSLPLLMPVFNSYYFATSNDGITLAQTTPPVPSIVCSLPALYNTAANANNPLDQHMDFDNDGYMGDGFKQSHKQNNPTKKLRGVIEQHISQVRRPIIPIADYFTPGGGPVIHLGECTDWDIHPRNYSGVISLLGALPSELSSRYYYANTHNPCNYFVDTIQRLLSATKHPIIPSTMPSLNFLPFAMTTLHNSFKSFTIVDLYQSYDNIWFKNTIISDTQPLFREPPVPSTYTQQFNNPQLQQPKQQFKRMSRFELTMNLLCSALYNLHHILVQQLVIMPPLLVTTQNNHNNNNNSGQQYTQKRYYNHLVNAVEIPRLISTIHKNMRMFQDHSVTTIHTLPNNLNGMPLHCLKEDVELFDFESVLYQKVDELIVGGVSSVVPFIAPPPFQGQHDISFIQNQNQNQNQNNNNDNTRNTTKEGKNKKQKNTPFDEKSTITIMPSAYDPPAAAHYDTIVEAYTKAYILTIKEYKEYYKQFCQWKHPHELFATKLASTADNRPRADPCFVTAEQAATFTPPTNNNNNNGGNQYRNDKDDDDIEIDLLAPGQNPVTLPSHNDRAQQGNSLLLPAPCEYLQSAMYQFTDDIELFIDVLFPYAGIYGFFQTMMRDLKYFAIHRNAGLIPEHSTFFTAYQMTSNANSNMNGNLFMDDITPVQQTMLASQINIDDFGSDLLDGISINLSMNDGNDDEDSDYQSIDSSIYTDSYNGRDGMSHDASDYTDSSWVGLSGSSDGDQDDDSDEEIGSINKTKVNKKDKQRQITKGNKQEQQSPLLLQQQQETDESKYQNYITAWLDCKQISSVEVHRRFTHMITIRNHPLIAFDHNGIAMIQSDAEQIQIRNQIILPFISQLSQFIQIVQSFFEIASNLLFAPSDAMGLLCSLYFASRDKHHNNNNNNKDEQQQNNNLTEQDDGRITVGYSIDKSKFRQYEHCIHPQITQLNAQVVAPVVTQQTKQHQNKFSPPLIHQNPINDIISSLFQHNIVTLPVLSWSALLVSSTEINTLVSSFTGSGKSVLLPLVLLLRAYIDIYSQNRKNILQPLSKPYICFVLPTKILVDEKVMFFKDFHPILRRDRILTMNDVLSRTRAIDLIRNNGDDPNFKPLQCDEEYLPKLLILTPTAAIQLYKQQTEFNPLFPSYCRWILDEMHCRLLEQDILLSQMNGFVEGNAFFKKWFILPSNVRYHVIKTHRAKFAALFFLVLNKAGHSQQEFQQKRFEHYVKSHLASIAARRGKKVGDDATAILLNKMNYFDQLHTVPQSLTLMSATPDSDLITSLGLANTFAFDIPSQRLYPISTLHMQLFLNDKKDKLFSLLTANTLWAIHDMFNPYLYPHYKAKNGYNITTADSLSFRYNLIKSIYQINDLKKVYPKIEVEKAQRDENLGLLTEFQTFSQSNNSTFHPQQTPQGDVLIFIPGLGDAYGFKRELLKICHKTLNHQYAMSNSGLTYYRELEQHNNRFSQQYHKGRTKNNATFFDMVDSLLRNSNLGFSIIPIEYEMRNAMKDNKKLYDCYRDVDKLIRSAYDKHMRDLSINNKNNNKNNNDDNNNNTQQNNKIYNKVIIIIPIPVCAIVNPLQKRFATEPLPKFLTQNKPYEVVKVIIATSAIESSITLPNLSVMIDSGLSKVRSFNNELQITMLNEVTISSHSRTQRIGRLGRLQSGTGIQLIPSWIGSNFVQQPQVKTIDLRSKFLVMRNMGIYLERLKKLPTPIEPNVLKSALDCLKVFKLLTPRVIQNKDDDKTQATQQLQNSNDIPFVMSSKGFAIVDWVEFLNPLYCTLLLNIHYGLSLKDGDSVDIGKLPQPDNKTTANTLFTALLLVTMLQYKNDTVANHNAMFLRVAFNDYSDLVTLMNVLLIYFSQREKIFLSKPFVIENFLGLSSKWVNDLYNGLKRIADGLGISEPYDEYFNTFLFANESLATKEGGIFKNDIRVSNNNANAMRDNDDGDDDSDGDLTYFDATEDDGDDVNGLLLQFAKTNKNRNVHITDTGYPKLFTVAEARALANQPHAIPYPAIIKPHQIPSLLGDSKWDISTIADDSLLNDIIGIPDAAKSFQQQIFRQKYDRIQLIEDFTQCDNNNITIPSDIPIIPTHHQLFTLDLLTTRGAPETDVLQQLLCRVANPLFLHLKIDCVLQDIRRLTTASEGTFRFPGEVCEFDGLHVNANREVVDIVDDFDDNIPFLASDIQKDLFPAFRGKYTCKSMDRDDLAAGGAAMGEAKRKIVSIQIQTRPGMLFPVFPRNVLIFGLQHDSTKKSMAGALVHTPWKSRKNAFFTEEEQKNRRTCSAVSNDVSNEPWPIELNKLTTNSQPLAVQSYIIPTTLATNPYFLVVLESILMSLIYQNSSFVSYRDQQTADIVYFPGFERTPHPGLMLYERHFILDNGSVSQNTKSSTSKSKKITPLAIIDDVEDTMMRDQHNFNIQVDDMNDDQDEVYFNTNTQHQQQHHTNNGTPISIVFPSSVYILTTTYTQILTHFWYKALLLTHQLLSIGITSILHVNTPITAVEHAICPFSGQYAAKLWVHGTLPPIRPKIPKVLNITFNSAKIFVYQYNKAILIEQLRATDPAERRLQNEQQRVMQQQNQNRGLNLFQQRGHQVNDFFSDKIAELNSGSIRLALVYPLNYMEHELFGETPPWKQAFSVDKTSNSTSNDEKSWNRYALFSSQFQQTFLNMSTQPFNDKIVSNVTTLYTKGVHSVFPPHEHNSIRRRDHHATAFDKQRLLTSKDPVLVLLYNNEPMLIEHEQGGGVGGIAERIVRRREARNIPYYLKLPHAKVPDDEIVEWGTIRSIIGVSSSSSSSSSSSLLSSSKIPSSLQSPEILSDELKQQIILQQNQQSDAAIVTTDPRHVMIDVGVVLGDDVLEKIPLQFSKPQSNTHITGYSIEHNQVIRCHQLDPHVNKIHHRLLRKHTLYYKHLLQYAEKIAIYRFNLKGLLYQLSAKIKEEQIKSSSSPPTTNNAKLSYRQDLCNKNSVLYQTYIFNSDLRLLLSVAPTQTIATLFNQMLTSISSMQTEISTTSTTSHLVNNNVKENTMTDIIRDDDIDTSQSALKPSNTINYSKYLLTKLPLQPIPQLPKHQPIKPKQPFAPILILPEKPTDAPPVYPAMHPKDDPKNIKRFKMTKQEKQKRQRNKKKAEKRKKKAQQDGQMEDDEPTEPQYKHGDIIPFTPEELQGFEDEYTIMLTNYNTKLKNHNEKMQKYQDDVTQREAQHAQDLEKYQNDSKQYELDVIQYNNDVELYKQLELQDKINQEQYITNCQIFINEYITPIYEYFYGLQELIVNSNHVKSPTGRVQTQIQTQTQKATTIDSKDIKTNNESNDQSFAFYIDVTHLQHNTALINELRRNGEVNTNVNKKGQQTSQKEQQQQQITQPIANPHPDRIHFLVDITGFLNTLVKILESFIKLKHFNQKEMENRLQNQIFCGLTDVISYQVQSSLTTTTTNDVWFIGPSQIDQPTNPVGILQFYQSLTAQNKYYADIEQYNTRLKQQQQTAGQQQQQQEQPVTAITSFQGVTLVPSSTATQSFSSPVQPQIEQQPDLHRSNWNKIVGLRLKSMFIGNTIPLFPTPPPSTNQDNQQQQQQQQQLSTANNTTKVITCANQKKKSTLLSPNNQISNEMIDVFFANLHLDRTTCLLQVYNIVPGLSALAYFAPPNYMTQYIKPAGSNNNNNNNNNNQKEISYNSFIHQTQQFRSVYSKCFPEHMSQEQQQQGKPQITSLPALRQVQNTTLQQQQQQQQDMNNNIQLPQLPIDKLSLFTIPLQFALRVLPESAHDIFGGNSRKMKNSDSDDSNNNDSEDDYNDGTWDATVVKFAFHPTESKFNPKESCILSESHDIHFCSLSRIINCPTDGTTDNITVYTPYKLTILFPITTIPYYIGVGNKEALPIWQHILPISNNTLLFNSNNNLSRQQQNSGKLNLVNSNNSFALIDQYNNFVINPKQYLTPLFTTDVQQLLISHCVQTLLSDGGNDVNGTNDKIIPFTTKQLSTKDRIDAEQVILPSSISNILTKQIAARFVGITSINTTTNNNNNTLQQNIDTVNHRLLNAFVNSNYHHSKLDLVMYTIHKDMLTYVNRSLKGLCKAGNNIRIFTKNDIKENNTIDNNNNQMSEMERLMMMADGGIDDDDDDDNDNDFMGMSNGGFEDDDDDEIALYILCSTSEQKLIDGCLNSAYRVYQQFKQRHIRADNNVTTTTNALISTSDGTISEKQIQDFVQELDTIDYQLLFKMYLSSSPKYSQLLTPPNPSTPGQSQQEFYALQNQHRKLWIQVLHQRKFIFHPAFNIAHHQRQIGFSNKAFCAPAMCDKHHYELKHLPINLITNTQFNYNKDDLDATTNLANFHMLSNTRNTSISLCLECLKQQVMQGLGQSVSLNPNHGYLEYLPYESNVNNDYQNPDEQVDLSKTFTCTLFSNNGTVVGSQSNNNNNDDLLNPFDNNTNNNNTSPTKLTVAMSYPTLLTQFVKYLSNVEETDYYQSNNDDYGQQHQQQKFSKYDFKTKLQHDYNQHRKLLYDILFSSYSNLRHMSQKMLETSRALVVTCSNPAHYRHLGAVTYLDVASLRARDVKLPHQCGDLTFTDHWGKPIDRRTNIQNITTRPCSWIYCVMCDEFHDQTQPCAYTHCPSKDHQFDLEQRIDLSTTRNQQSTPCRHPKCTYVYCTRQSCIHKKWHKKDDPNCDVVLCPQHPQEDYSKATLKRLLAETPGSTFTCRHPNCGYWYCTFCTAFHAKVDMCTTGLKLKRCPRCKVASELIAGCAHITCSCGCHWCWFCKKSPDFASGSACYGHLTLVHGDYYRNLTGRE